MAICPLAVVIPGFLLFAAALSAQEFEVATVRPSTADVFDNNERLPSLNIEPGRRLHFANITLKDAMMLAWGIGARQISGPDLLIDRFDIAAQIPADATKDQIPLMLQRLLTQRFKITFHREQRNIPVYALEIGTGGPKLSESAAGDTSEPGCTRSWAEMPEAHFMAVCRKMTSGALVQAVQTVAPNYFDRPLVDKTGLEGMYDVTFEWISYAKSQSGAPGPTVFTSIQKLGLRIEARRQSMEIFVIDHCEKMPAEN